MKLFLEVIVVCYAIALVRSDQSFNYERRQNFGIGNRPILSVRRSNGYGAYPEPLPSTKASNAYVRDPFSNVYQGTRRKNYDVRVFKKDFDYPPSSEAHKISCESLVDCTISHLAIETEDGIPIILRGGVGYHHFSIIVRAKPGNPLKGTIRVYCVKPDDEEKRQFIKTV